MSVNEELKALFYPKTVAVIGATSSSGKPGNIIIKQLLSSGAKIYPVHPKETEIEGMNVINNIENLPENIDLAVVTLGALRAVEAAEICAVKGSKVIIVIAGGFGEAGEEGKLLEKRLGLIPAKFGSRVLGPEHPWEYFFRKTNLILFLLSTATRLLLKAAVLRCSRKADPSAPKLSVMPLISVSA